MSFMSTFKMPPPGRGNRKRKRLPPVEASPLEFADFNLLDTDMPRNVVLIFYATWANDAFNYEDTYAEELKCIEREQALPGLQETPNGYSCQVYTLHIYIYTHT